MLNEIILGALIAGLIGLTTSMAHTLITEKRELKKIKICLKNEIQQNIYLITRKQINLKSFLGKGDIKRDRTNDEWDKIQQQFDFGCFYLEILLANAIYSNNNIFKLSDQQLKTIRNVQAAIKCYNDELQGWYDFTRNILDKQFNPNMLDNQNTRIPLIVFFSKHIELNTDIKIKLESLKQRWDHPISSKQFEKSAILAWQKGTITKEQAENMISDHRLYQVEIIEQDGKKSKIAHLTGNDE